MTDINGLTYLQKLWARNDWQWTSRYCWTLTTLPEYQGDTETIEDLVFLSRLASYIAHQM